MSYRDEPDVYMSVHYSCINYVQKVRPHGADSRDFPCCLALV